MYGLGWLTAVLDDVPFSSLCVLSFISDMHKTTVDEREEGEVPVVRTNILTHNGDA